MEKLITNRMVGLFLVTALTVSGCSSQGAALDEDECYDDDGDSYCDDGGGGAYGMHYINGRKVYYRSAFADVDIDGKKKPSTGISKGVSGSKGGIGSSTGSGG
ncbi:hypothetical protein FE782_25340 [Paenibacillus antri]|uniref:Uncharacterized protein n=1 Tax=Paenibacillus antri TaxID=2582848 RepID=A0A5R9FZF2_9BACL|nr:hypothetical protein [Paenibacillus antri]TLS49442.1 hypothetical protein FE782_25340 [Paenibacillus antri]